TTVWFEYGLHPELKGQAVETVAGSTSGFAEGSGADALFDQPWGLASDRDGNTYVADTLNHRIRRIAPDGSTSTIAGTGVAGFADGPGDTAQFNEPVGIVVAPDRTLFVTDSKNHRIRAISVDGEVRTHSGLGVAGFTDGVGIAARFNLPWGLALDERGTLYLADRGNHRIRTVAPDGRAGTLAGTGAPGFNDGSGEVAQFDGPRGLALSPTGLLYLTDTGSNRVRRLTPD
ncbi:MAG: hypothetical protein GWO24_02415, partial [Akkermansiaceae bacterium]|nr:hypothetical protein [Akkermansiaceae bacterium]